MQRFVLLILLMLQASELAAKDFTQAQYESAIESGLSRLGAARRDQNPIRSAEGEQSAYEAFARYTGEREVSGWVCTITRFLSPDEMLIRFHGIGVAAALSTITKYGAACQSGSVEYRVLASDSTKAREVFREFSVGKEVRISGWLLAPSLQHMSPGPTASASRPVLDLNSGMKDHIEREGARIAAEKEQNAALAKADEERRAADQKKSGEVGKRLAKLIVQQLSECYRPPAGAPAGLDKLGVRLSFQLRPDGTLAAPPKATSGTASARGGAIEAAERAVLACQPYSLPANAYDAWKRVEVDFNPSQLFGR